MMKECVVVVHVLLQTCGGMCNEPTLPASQKHSKSIMSAAGTHNSEGINVDLYIPRKW